MLTSFISTNLSHFNENESRPKSPSFPQIAATLMRMRATSKRKLEDLFRGTQFQMLMKESKQILEQ